MYLVLSAAAAWILRPARVLSTHFAGPSKVKFKVRGCVSYGAYEYQRITGLADSDRTVLERSFTQGQLC